MNEQTARFRVPPLEKTILVKCQPARAFVAFTQEIAAWWPLSTHSVGQDKAKTCAIEPWVGGRIFETDEQGQEHVWGHVTLWSPPVAFAMSWHPGRSPDSAQRVTLRFTADGQGTRVTLVHDGWAVLAERAQAVRENYDQGWDKVFCADFKRHADRPNH